MANFRNANEAKGTRILLEIKHNERKTYFNVEIIRGIPLPKLAKNWNNKHYLHSIKLFWFMQRQYTAN